MISGIDHVAITVSDLDEACRFYERVLDAKIEDNYMMDGKLVVRRVAIGKAIFNIHQQGNGIDLVARHPTPGSVDICFRWGGTIEEAQARLEDRGVEIIEGPVIRISSEMEPAQSVYFKDPDGNLVELLALA